MCAMYCESESSFADCDLCNDITWKGHWGDDVVARLCPGSRVRVSCPGSTEGSFEAFSCLRPAVESFSKLMRSTVCTLPGVGALSCVWTRSAECLET